MTPQVDFLGNQSIVTWPGTDYRIRLTDIHQGDHGVYAQIWIERAHSKNGSRPVIYWSELALGSGDRREAVARTVSNQTNLTPEQWSGRLTQACTLTVMKFREGEEVVAAHDIDPPEAPAYFLYPLLPLNETSILFGQGSAGKSWFATAIALSAAAGQTMCKGVQPPVNCPVLYLDWETSAAEFGRRLTWLADGMGVGMPDEVYYRHCSRPIASELGQIQLMIHDRGVEFLVVDSLSMAVGGDLTNAADAREAMEALASLRDVTVLALAHVTKERIKEGRGPGSAYGSVMFTNQGRSDWEIISGEQHEAESTTYMNLGLFQRKTNFRPSDPMIFSRAIDDEGHACWFERSDLDQATELQKYDKKS